MTIKNRLASALGRRDEEPNIALAKTIAETKDKKAITELVACLSDKNKDIQNDSIKVLYEAGALDATLIADHIDVLVDLLSSRNNRLQWGAMTALNSVTCQYPRQIYEQLTRLVKAAESGSVITNDQLTRILVKLCATKAFGNDAFELLRAIAEKPA